MSTFRKKILKHGIIPKYLILNIIHIGTVIVIPGSPVEPSGFLIDSSDILYYNDRKFLSIFTKCNDRE